MTPSNGLVRFPSYSAEAEMAYGSLDEFEASYTQNFQDGFQPLQTYPAKFHNTVVKFLFQQAQQTYLLCSSIFNELSNAITDSGQTLDATDLTQLKKAITKLSELQVATATVLGGVKSSAAAWKVAVDAEGVMSVNTTSATRAAAGLIQLPEGTSTTRFLREDGTWQELPLYAFLQISSGKLYVKLKATAAAETGWTLGTDGITLPTSATHATSATYLRPASSTSTLVTADSAGNLKAHTLALS